MAKNRAYLSAEKKIKKALRSGATELDLTGGFLPDEKLEYVPISLKKVSNLKVLILDENDIEELPDWLGYLSNLEVLSISRNMLDTLPTTIQRLKKLKELNLSHNYISYIPYALSMLTGLKYLTLSGNESVVITKEFKSLRRLEVLNLNGCLLYHVPDFLSNLKMLKELNLSGNRIQEIPEWLFSMEQLRTIDLANNLLKEIPDLIVGLTSLTYLNVSNCQLSDLPACLFSLPLLNDLKLEQNPFNPELEAAVIQGQNAVRAYFRAKSQSQTNLNEAKLILIGEGEVGKSCLLSALRNDKWEEGKPTTHGIEIKPVKVIDPTSDTEIILNGWDFGGQRVYRPTHQLFFTAPAVYLVVWKPREGPQQGFVKEWIKLVKHREPDAKIIVVATHGGPNARQPDIDRQEIWDLFGKDTVVNFFFVQSKPNNSGTRHGVPDLKDDIANIAAKLPEMGRTFPKHWQDARVTLRSLLSMEQMVAKVDSCVSNTREAKKRIENIGKNRLCLESALSELSDLLTNENQAREEFNNARIAYLPLTHVYKICKEHGVENEDTQLLLQICNRVGDLIHYEHDPLLKDIVVLKPDWLATAISFVLDDETTRRNSGLITFERLSQLWDNPEKELEERYPAELHCVFVRLMERFDLCYKVSEPGRTETERSYLIAQLVPDVRPDISKVWKSTCVKGEIQQIQICRIIETSKNETANAEGLFYQLIVRLHKYSIGKDDHRQSVHWQRGLILIDDYGATAFLEHTGNDIRIAVRSPYPQQFLGALTYEVKYLVESFWEGLRCMVTVPCLEPIGQCDGLFEVEQLLENKRRGRPEQPCSKCNSWQNIEELLNNAPASQPNPLDSLLEEFSIIKQQLSLLHGMAKSRFDNLDVGMQRNLSRIEQGFNDLLRILVDEAREGPRLFSFQPAEAGFFDRPDWISQKFRLTLWCEHSRLPLCKIKGQDGRVDADMGVYTLNIPRDWLSKSAPFLRVLTTTLSLVLPVAASATKTLLDDTAYKAMEDELQLGQKSIDSVLKGADKVGSWIGRGDGIELRSGKAKIAHSRALHQLQNWLKEQDPNISGMIRVQNKKQEFLWVHPRFANEY